MTDTDAELTRRAASGDSTAFQQLYERHWKAVYRFAWLLTASVQDAQDITQECFLALIRNPAVFDPSRGQLRTWLLAVVRNQHLQRVRRAARESDSGDTGNAGESMPADEALIRAETATAVRRAVSALPLPQREALFLFEFEGLSLAETAAALQIEANAVKARLYRARAQLKLLLAPFWTARGSNNENTDVR